MTPVAAWVALGALGCDELYQERVLSITPRMSEHYLLLGDALEAFAAEIRSTGQTLPFHSNEAVATILRMRGNVFVGIQCKRPLADRDPLVVLVATAEGEEKMPLPKATATHVTLRPELGEWFVFDEKKGKELPDGARILQLKTASSLRRA